MRKHSLDPYPIPKDTTPLFINEPSLVDKTLLDYPSRTEPDAEEDNVRIYIPMDLNKKAILRRLENIIASYSEVNEENEMYYEQDVRMLISQAEIYDRVWYIRHMPQEGNHSTEGIILVKEIISRLEDIPDGGAESFPFDLISELESEYCR